MVDRLLHAPLSQAERLPAAFARGLHEKHMVLNFNNPSLQRKVDDAGFGGVLPAPLSDSLLVNDANLSAGKGDLVVSRRYSLSAFVAPDGEVRDTLRLSYHNPTPSDPAIASLVRATAGTYRNYVRVYIPETARLESMSLTVNGETNNVTPESIDYEYQRESVAYFLIVPHGGDATLTLTYSGPFADASQSPERYALAWQKQINALHWPVSVTISMAGKQLRDSTDLSTDRAWSLSTP
jgi:hypothetical protein